MPPSHIKPCPNLFPTWGTDLSEFIQTHADKPRFGIRASCIENWSYKYIDAGMKSSDAEYPSHVRRSLHLENLGLVSKVVYLKTERESARVFCRGEGFSSDDLFVYIGTDWYPESYLTELTGPKECLRYLTARRETAELFAREIRKQRRKARKDEREEKETADEKALKSLESYARDSIRAALKLKPHAAHVYGKRPLIQKEREDHKIELAMGRWRRHYNQTGESLSGAEALMPKRLESRAYKRNQLEVGPLKKKTAPTYYFETNTPQEPPQRIQEPEPEPEPEQAPYEAPSVYQAPSVLSYGDEPTDYFSYLNQAQEPAPEPEQAQEPTSTPASKDYYVPKDILEAERVRDRILANKSTTAAQRVAAMKECEQRSFEINSKESVHNMSFALARDERALREADRREGQRMLGINQPQPVSLAPWATILGDWLERAEREVWETQHLLTNEVKSVAAPMFCIPASSLRLAVDKHFGQGKVSPRKLGAFMREQGFGAGNKMWRAGKAIRVFYKNCASPADPQRMIVCNANDDGRSVTWGMERGAVLRAQI